MTLTASIDPQRLRELGEKADADGRAEFTLELHGEDANGRTVIKSAAHYQLRPNRG